MPNALPIDDLREDFSRAFKESSRIIVEAPTGSGKSTRLPQFALDSGLLPAHQQVVILQPRRLPTRMLARRVAAERGCQLGAEVGYQIRFESHVSAATRIRFVTEALLLRQLIAEPTLPEVGAIIFDEFHERHLSTDLTLALARQLQQSARPDLRMIITSATLDSETLQQWLAPATLLRSSGRMFPVDIRYQPLPAGHGAPPIWTAAARHTARALAASPDGDALVFMPGAYEINRTISELQALPECRNCDVLPLYGDLPADAQDRAVTPSTRRRIIVSTNVAETSLTIDGITLVVDSGLAKAARFDPHRGINTLLTEKISRAAADQRAGRAGRTAAGTCLRLWSEGDHAQRPIREDPEIQRVDLAEPLLLLAAAGFHDPAAFPWLEQPPESSLTRARTLLTDLGACRADGSLSEDGRQLARLPVHPRYGRLLLEASRRGCTHTAARVAAVAQGRPIRLDPKAGATPQADDDADSDFISHLQAMDLAAVNDFDPVRCRKLGIHATAARQAQRVASQLHGLAKQLGLDCRPRDDDPAALRKCILAAFSDQLAIRRDEGTLRCRLIHNRSGELRRTSAARGHTLLVAAEIDEMKVRNEVITLLSMVTPIEEQWLHELFPADFSTTTEVSFDRIQKRVVSRRKTLFRDLVLDESISESADSDAAAELLAAEIRNGTIQLRQWDDAIEMLITRINCAATHCPELEISPLDDNARSLILQEFCHGARSVRELQQKNLRHAILGWLSPEQQLALATVAPEEISLPNRKRPVRIRYNDDHSATIAATVQDLYDSNSSNLQLANGRIPLRFEILAPNRRPIQITANLNQFWSTSYPDVKKQLKGRYPKHEWR